MFYLIKIELVITDTKHYCIFYILFNRIESECHTSYIHTQMNGKQIQDPFQFLSEHCISLMKPENLRLYSMNNRMTILLY